MGTVGINFGPINSGQGFDVASTVSQILAAEQAVEDPWKSQLSTLQAQDTALSKMGTDLASLSTAMQALTDFSGVFASKQGASSDTNVVELTSASNLAVAGSHTVVVNSLAQTSSQYSDLITNSADTLTGSLTVTIGGQSQSLNVSGQTLSQLAASINGASMGVAASVVTDTTGSRLSLVSRTSGAAGQITLSSSLTDDATSTAIAFQQGMQGLDASLTVDGLNTTSASNTVTGLIPGVTFQILAVSSNPSVPVQVQITNNNSSIEQAFGNFVSAYNAVADDIKTQEGKDSTGKPEPLFGDPTVALIQNQLSQGLLTISNQEQRIADDKSRLTDQLNSANQILQALPDQLNQINQLYSAITGYNSTGQ
jgi:flagellar hook-associated protein 2